MEKIEKEHFKIEIYSARIDYLYIGWLAFLGVSFLLLYLYIFTFFPLLLIYIFFILMIGVHQINRIILTRDAFIQTLRGGVIPWEDIDHVEYHPGQYRKRLIICYKKDNQIKKFGTSYADIKDREQFLKSLREFSKMYEFDIEEK
jgi:hypothetical protein